MSTEPVWLARSSLRPIGRNPEKITHHECGCVTGWDDAFEDCLLARCDAHADALAQPATRPPLDQPLAAAPVEWSVGQLAEIEWGEPFAAALERRSLVRWNGKHWRLMDDGQGCVGVLSSWVTAVRPLRLVPDDGQPLADAIAEERRQIIADLNDELAKWDTGNNAEGSTWQAGAAWGLEDAIATVQLRKAEPDQSSLPSRDVLVDPSFARDVTADDLKHGWRCGSCGRLFVEGDTARGTHVVTASGMHLVEDWRCGGCEGRRRGDLAEVRARVLAIPAGSYRRDLGFDAAISRVLQVLEEFAGQLEGSTGLVSAADSAPPQVEPSRLGNDDDQVTVIRGDGSPLDRLLGYVANDACGDCTEHGDQPCRVGCSTAGAETPAAPSSGTGTPAEALSTRAARDATTMRGPGGWDGPDRYFPAEAVSGGSGDAERQESAEVARLTDRLAESERERTELFVEATAAHRESVQIIRDQAREVARYRAAVEQAMPRLVYASSPTMGLPAGRDAAEFASEATELMAREALRNCILNARDAKAYLAAALGDGA